MAAGRKDSTPELTMPRTTTVPGKASARRQRPFLVADLFAGAGGTSEGARRALESLGHDMVLTVVNHWDVAVASHKANHPDARHYCQDIASIRPITAVPEGRLDLLLASPSCVHFSRARGGKPMTDQSRSDPWHVLQWLTELRVSRLIVENVPEILSWGKVNVNTGKPLKSEQGRFFKAWVQSIRQLGFKVEYRVLNCADYGDATSRQRFFLIARSDGKPLRWPTPTHSKTGAIDLFGTGAKRWRGASEIIDWHVKGRSIYQRRRALSAKSMLRILSGITRFGWHPGYAKRLIRFMLENGVPQADIEAVVKRSEVARSRQLLSASASAAYRTPERIQPFIAVVAHGNETVTENARRIRDIGAPLDTIHAGGGAFGLVEPAFTLSQASGGEPKHVREPLPTIVGGGAVSLIAPYYSGGSGETCTSTALPLPTITTKGRLGLVTTDGVQVEEHGQTLVVPFGSRSPHGQQGLVLPLTHAGCGDRVRSTDDPLPTVTGANRGELAFISAAFGERDRQMPRTHGLEQPVPTICAQGRVNLVTQDGERGEDFEILFRMLTVPELARATSLDLPGRDYALTGTKTEKIKQIGNAVPSGTAEALIRAMI